MKDPRAAALRALQVKLGYEWRRRELLLQALRHPSFTGGKRSLSNQRLEFMGDSVIDLVVTMHLMKLHPAADEGFLTQERVKMVKDEVLADKARKLGLHELIEIQKTAPRLRGLRSTAADCMEAVIGAAFVDSDSDLKTIQTVVCNAGILE